MKCNRCGIEIEQGSYCETCMIIVRDRMRDHNISQRYKKKYSGNLSLDEMAKEAHEKHISYGKLQSLETIGRRKG